MLLTLWSFPCVTEPEHGCGAKHGKLARRAGRLLAAAAWICSIKRLWNCLVERWDSKASCEAAAWKVGKNAKILKVRGKSKAFCPLFVITGTPGICVLSPSQGCVNQIWDSFSSTQIAVRIPWWILVLLYRTFGIMEAGELDCNQAALVPKCHCSPKVHELTQMCTIIHKTQGLGLCHRCNTVMWRDGMVTSTEWLRQAPEKRLCHVKTKHSSNTWTILSAQLSEGEKVRGQTPTFTCFTGGLLTPSCLKWPGDFSTLLCPGS